MHNILLRISHTPNKLVKVHLRVYDGECSEVVSCLEGSHLFIHSHELIHEYAEQEDINVVILDWRRDATNIWYPQAAANTRSIGAYTALVFDNLAKSGGSGSRMWCVGHSLGSHVCGHAGMRKTLDRVTDEKNDSIQLLRTLKFQSCSLVETFSHVCYRVCYLYFTHFHIKSIMFCYDSF
jgi:hypothetical protein